MAYCPSIDCPHRRRIGKPAEFMEGVTHCSDCGTELIAESPETESVVREKGFSDLTSRILFTLVMVVFWRLISMIPVPGIDFEALDSFVNSRGGLDIFGLTGNMKIGALGIGPYIMAYVIMELSALFIPDFKAWRADGPEGRMKLRRWALMMTVFIAFVSGYGIAVGIEEMAYGAFVPYPGIKFRLIVSLTMTAVVCLYVWTTNLVTKRGIGHGISILVLSGILPSFFTQALDQMRKLLSDVEVVQSGFRPPFNSIFVIILFSILFMVVSIAFIVFVERSQRKIPVNLKDGKEAYLPLKLTAAGITPASLFVPTILSIPVIFFRVPGTEPFPPLVNALADGGTVYFILYFSLVILFYFFLAAKFNNPGKLADFVSTRNAGIILPSGTDMKSYVNKSLRIMAILGALYLFAVVALYRWFWLKGVALILGGLVLIKAVAISMDIWGELKARKRMGRLMKVNECHDVPKAGYLKSILETHGIPCHVQGYYHRALYYIFGPYLEMSVLVPEEKQGEAMELAEKYFQ